MNPLENSALKALTVQDLHRRRNAPNATIIDRQAIALELVRRGRPARPPEKT